MDFTTELAAFQGAIISADNVHDLSEIASKGGNEEKVNFVIQSLKRFLKAENYIDDNGLIYAKIPNTRKFAMYIILNADLNVIHDMIDIAEIEPILWSVPALPKYLVCEMIWQLHMETFAYEIIPKCWPQLGIEVAEAFLENFKYFGPTECLNKLSKLSAACYALLCRLICFKFRENLSSTLTAAFENFQKFLKYYIELPNKHRLDALSNDELYKFKGQRFKNILNLVYECFTMYTQDTNPNCDDPIYRITYSIDYLQNTTCKVCESPCEVVLEFINNSNTLLLDTFKEVVMDISVDIFCAWSEFEEEGKSMQQAIGELCDKVQRVLQSVSSVSEHPVVSMIQQMARKPTEIKDIINATDTASIVSKIYNTGEESLLWIHALVYKDHLLRDMELVKVVKDYLSISIYDDKECFILFNAFKTVPGDSDSLANRELLLSAKILSFSGCNLLDKHNILKEHFREKTFINTMIDEDFDVQLNVMFNKFIADIDVDFTDVFTLFFQNPRKVYTKIFGLATQNTKLIEPMLKVMILLKDYTEYCYNTETEPCMITVMKYILNKCLQEGYVGNILQFICDLKNNNIISSSQLLMLVVMPSIHEALIIKDTYKIQIQVEILSKAYTVDELMSYRAPMLVMMAQIMEIVRLRSLGTFRILALKTLQIVIKFQKSIIDTYKEVIPDTDGSWLRQKVQDLKLHPLNFYYFKSLWNGDSKCFFECITDYKVHKGARYNILSLHLTQVLPWATTDEWRLIWDNFIEGDIRPLDALRMFHSAVDVLTHKIEEDRTVNTMACLFYCLANLLHIIRYKYLTEPLTDFQVSTCCVLLAHNLRSCNAVDAGDIGTLIMPLFAYLAERKNDYTVNVPKYFANTNYLYSVTRYIPNDMETI